MALTTITIGSVDYVSYASVVEADARLAVDAGRSAAWSALSNDEKGSRLVQATYRLDLLSFGGQKTNGDAQANAFPRTGLTYASGGPVSSTEVPGGVQDATSLLAGSIALDASAGNAGSSGSNVKSVKAGSTGVTFFRQTTGVPLADETAYILVREFLSASGVTSSSVGGLVSGEDEASVFGDRDAWGRTIGFP